MAEIELEVIGNLGRDAEKKEINGREYLSFRVAPRGSGDGGDTMWVSVLYGNLKVRQWLTKGRQVLVRGEYRDRLYARQDGTAGIDRSVLATRLVLLGGGGSSEQNPLTQPQTAQQGQGYQYPNYGNAPQQGQPAQQGWQFPAAPLTQPQQQQPTAQPAPARVDDDLPF